MTYLFYFSYAALWVLVCLLLILVVGSLRLIGILYSRTPRGQPATRIGQKLKDLKLYTLDGEPVLLSGLVKGMTNLVVISAQCSACERLLEFIREWTNCL